MANQAHVTKQGPGDEDDGAHRLRDIVVEEVSLVDRAANKRRFLVVKRSGDMPDDEKQAPEGKTDERGVTTARVEKAKKKSKAKPDDEEMEKARRRAGSAADEEEETEKVRRRASAEEEEDAAVEKARARAKPTVGGRPEANEDAEEGITEKADGDEDDDDDLVFPAA